MCNLLKKIGFNEKIKGSHHIYTYNKIEEIINIQPVNNKAKEYQVRQIRRLLLKYRLWRNINEEI